MIKAIETRYAGCRFRSRLEARWAVAFTTAGVDWQYEPEGFETPHGRYLPDFSIRTPLTERAATLRGTSPRWWIEIKHEDYAAGPEEQHRWWDVACGTNAPLVLLFGLDSGGLFLTPDRQLFEKSGDALTLGSHAIRAARSARFEHGQSGA